jgi:hypothetical protein
MSANLTPLLKVQEAVFTGKLTPHQIESIAHATDGAFLSMVSNCSDAYDAFRRSQAAGTQDAAAVNRALLCPAIVLCREQLKEYSICLMARANWAAAEQNHLQNGGPPPEGAPPSCARGQQKLDACVVKFSSTVLDAMLKSV